MSASSTAIKYFAEISKIPRCSGNEEQIRSFLCKWADEHGFKRKIDPAGNLLIVVPASPGYENRQPLILQSHMDMVCEKTPKSSHNFSTDPIKLNYVGDWLKAEDTTLGADNGIGIAIAMALGEEKDLIHPPLELLFTVDEESGLTGANALSPGFFSGRVLINIDSEDEGVFTIGCAGGRDSEIILPLEFAPCPAKPAFIELCVHGLKGGHSGVNIGEQRGNANVILAQLLLGIKKVTPYQLAALSGGSAHNAIPREAKAVISLIDDKSNLQATITNLTKTLRKTFHNEPELAISCKPTNSELKRMYSEKSTAQLLDLLILAPHGVMAMSQDVNNLVETSINFATIQEKNREMVLLFSQRSDRVEELAVISNRLQALAHLAGAAIFTSKGYPGWQPDIKAELLIRCQRIYRQLFKREAKVEVIHAGLECGIIGAISPGMEMISIGPTIENPHSPAERLHIPSVKRVCQFIQQLVSSYCADK